MTVFCLWLLLENSDVKVWTRIVSAKTVLPLPVEYFFGQALLILLPRQVSLAEVHFA